MRELKWADVATDRISLPPGVGRLVDICHVARVREGKTWRTGVMAGVFPLGSWDFASPRSPLWVEARPGRYSFHLTVAARDVRARAAVVTVELPAVVDRAAAESALRGWTVAG